MPHEWQQARGKFWTCTKCLAVIIGTEDAPPKHAKRCTQDDATPTKERPQRRSQQPCRHLGTQIGEVPCGCGSRTKTLPVMQCHLLGPTTQTATGKPQRWQGLKITCCLGCPQWEASE